LAFFLVSAAGWFDRGMNIWHLIDWLRKRSQPERRELFVAIIGLFLWFDLLSFP
jgi:hypothetical protein